MCLVFGPGGTVILRAGGGQSPQLTGDALGAQLFVSGKPDVGAIGCGSCHTMKAAGTSGTIGPNLDKELTSDPASATRESIVDPNKEIITGYSANVMPTNYGTALTKQELDALVNYVYRSTNTKAKPSEPRRRPPLPRRTILLRRQPDRVSVFGWLDIVAGPLAGGLR